MTLSEVRALLLSGESTVFELEDSTLNRFITQIVKGYTDSFMERNSGIYLEYSKNGDALLPLIFKHGIGYSQSTFCVGKDGSINSYDEANPNTIDYHTFSLGCFGINVEVKSVDDCQRAAANALLLKLLIDTYPEHQLVTTYYAS